MTMTRNRTLRLGLGLIAALTLVLLSSTPALAGDGKPWALSLFDYSMGLTSGAGSASSCLSCNFLTYFMISLTDFSYSTYLVLYDILIALIPLTLMIWLATRVIKLMISGGEDGKGFIMQLVHKLTLFVFVWLILLGGGTTSTIGKQYLWGATGPMFLESAFKLSNEIRSKAIAGQSLATVSVGSTGTVTDDALFCPDIDLHAYTTSDPIGTGLTPYSFLDEAVRTGCMTERVHFMGVASGVAIGLGQISSPTTWFDIAYYLFQLAVKLLLGVFVGITFALSAVWLIFLILDVVVRAMITAAFSPVLIALFLYQPTRSISSSAIKSLIGSAVTAVAIGLVGVLAYVLITNTVAVYNATYAAVDADYETYDLKGIPEPGFSSPSPASGSIPGPAEDMRELIERTEIGNTDEGMGIPMDVGTPWFWYIAFCGLAIFSLGKKIITMLEQAIGTAGMSAFADRATNMAKFATKTGATVGLGGAVGVAGASLFAAGKLGVPMASYAFGGAKKGGDAGLDAAMGAMSSKGRHNTLKGVGMLKSAGTGAAKGAKLGAVAGGAGGMVAGNQATTDE